MSDWHRFALKTAVEWPVRVCDAEQSELVCPVEAALERYVRLQEEMEMERPGDDDAAHSLHQQQQQLSQQAAAAASMAVKPQNAAIDKSSSGDGLGLAADYKFKVQKIVARPAAK